jgi:hypothetical protein
MLHVLSGSSTLTADIAGLFGCTEGHAGLAAPADFGLTAGNQAAAPSLLFVVLHGCSLYSLPAVQILCVCVEGAFDNLVAITMRDVNSRRVPTPGLDRHTSRPVIIQSTPVPPTTLCPLPGSLALCLCTRVVPRCHGRDFAIGAEH